MQFLAVDTSNHYMSVVAVKGEKVYASFTPDCAMKHSVLLLSKIEETLQAADMQLADCDFFCAVVGAGSFTGIRIGVSAIKGFALATGKKTLPITSFDCVAYNALDGGKILALVDAAHDSYYACGYERGEVVLPPSYLSEEEVLELVEKGYAPYACDELPITKKTPVTRVNPTTGLINAAKALAAKGAFGELNALYVRKSSAEENRP